MGVPREKISVVYQGLDVAFRQGMGKLKSDPLTALGLTTQQYFLCVSTLEPRKKYRRLLDAYLQLPKGVRNRYPVSFSRGLWMAVGSNPHQSVGALIRGCQVSKLRA